MTPEQAPELHQMIDRLCALADMPKPKVAVADSDLPNAFATGRNQKHAVVCVTTGILRRLSAPELEAVLSHELSHVAHRDVAVMTIASFLGILAGFVVRSSIYAGAYGGGGWGRSNDRDNNAGAVILLVVLASAVVYALSFLLTRLLSRYRELSADRAGAILIGRPSLLAAALVKITGDMARIPHRDLRAARAAQRLLLRPGAGPRVQLLDAVRDPPAPRPAPRAAGPAGGRARPAGVKFLDALLGRSRPKQPQLDALFGVTGAAITLEASAGTKPTGQAAVCFKPASGQSFAAASEELTGLLELAVKEAGSTLAVTDDRYGYRWVVLSDPEMEDLVTSAHLVNATLEQHGFGPQLLCSVFAFADEQGRRFHLVYLYKRGSFYPFAPLDGERRDNELELRVKATLGGELPVEPELARWFALWGLPLG